MSGTKARAQKLLTNSHRGWNKEAISGISKTYQPKDDDGDQHPSESKQIHLNVPEKVRATMKQVASFFDVVLTQEKGNTQAKSDIQIDGEIFLNDMPVTTLLFLEHQLVDLHTFAENLPTLPPDREWKPDANRNCFVTDPIQSIKTAKKEKPIVLYEATKEHPAQCQLFSEDIMVGKWTTTYMSSAIPSRQRADILRRIEEMQDAVKRARENANSCEVNQLTYGGKILSHIFGDLLSESDAK